MELLPKSHAQFHEKSYWDSFFRERGEEAFEWYGEFQDLAGLLFRSIKREHKILVIGCGNSNLSACLYDKGFTSITNLDFSETVIAEMRAKNVSRERMEWIVGDMTNMPQFSDGAFDVVLDKGALDALMSEASEQSFSQADAMFSEIARVLSSVGKYACITLAENFILNSILNYFCGQASSWSISVEVVPCQKPSPFLPFYFISQRSSAEPESVPRLVKVYIDNLGNKILTPTTLEPGQLSIQIQSIQKYHQKRYDLGEIRVGRFESVDFWAPGSGYDSPRFTFIVVDSAASAARTCAVFFIPMGRESEYRFFSEAGLLAVADSAGCKRLIAVRCNKPHHFQQMAELQTELSPLVMTLRPRGMRTEETIPFMALDEASEWENIFTGQTELSGRYVVEQAPVENDDSAVQRRLIFLQNQNFIQSEVRLVAPSQRKEKSASSNNKKSKCPKKSSNAKQSVSTGAGGAAGGGVGGGAGADPDVDAERLLEFDVNHLDGHHRALLAACSLCPELIRTGGSSKCDASKPVPDMLVIGLGGGAVAMALQHYLPRSRLDIAELDPEMEAIAAEHFKFKRNEGTVVHATEGMAYVRELLSRCGASRDLILVDVDSKDPALALSAPPAAFLTQESLTSLLGLLRPGGCLALNVVARAPGLLNEVVADIRTAGAALSSSGGGFSLFTLKPTDDTVNVLVIAVRDTSPAETQTASSSNAGAGSGGKKASGKPVTAESRQRAIRENLVEDWLKGLGRSSDPLKLVDLIAKIVLVKDT